VGISSQEKGGNASETNVPNANCRINIKEIIYKRKFSHLHSVLKKGSGGVCQSFFSFFGIARTICTFGSFLVLCISFGGVGGEEECNVEEHVGLFVVLERFRYCRSLCGADI